MLYWDTEIQNIVLAVPWGQEEEWDDGIRRIPVLLWNPYETQFEDVDGTLQAGREDYSEIKNLVSATQPRRGIKRPTIEPAEVAYINVVDLQIQVVFRVNNSDDWIFQTGSQCTNLKDYLLGLAKSISKKKIGKSFKK